MERCPSGLRCMIGNHVDGEYRHGGSNPPLSARKGRSPSISAGFLHACFSICGQQEGHLSGSGEGCCISRSEIDFLESVGSRKVFLGI